MKMKRNMVVILVLGVTLTLVGILRDSRDDGTVSSVSNSLKSSPAKQIKVAQENASGRSDSQRSASPPASERVISSAGKEVLLKIYADHTFQLHLPENSNGIYVRHGTKLFTSENDHPDEVPDGVWIRIRNGVGEIFTLSGGPHFGDDAPGWYRPVLVPSRIEMPVFARRDANGEAIPLVSKPSLTELSTPAERMSPRVKLSTLIARLPRNIRNQSGLEFKLSITPAGFPFAHDIKGSRLNLQDFPRHETGWLDGDLLFDDE